MDFTALVESFLRRVEGRRLERLAAELWKFAEALDVWLHHLFAHPSTDWPQQLNTFLAWQEAEGRRAMPESRRSLLDYLTWWSTSIGLEPASPQRAPVAATSESSGETSVAPPDEETESKQPGGRYPEAFGPAAGMLEEEMRSRSALAMPPLVGEPDIAEANPNAFVEVKTAAAVEVVEPFSTNPFLSIVLPPEHTNPGKDFIKYINSSLTSGIDRFAADVMGSYISDVLGTPPFMPVFQFPGQTWLRNKWLSWWYGDTISNDPKIAEKVDTFLHDAAARVSGWAPGTYELEPDAIPVKFTSVIAGAVLNESTLNRSGTATVTIDNAGRKQITITGSFTLDDIVDAKDFKELYEDGALSLPFPLAILSIDEGAWDIIFEKLKLYGGYEFAISFSKSYTVTR